MPQMYPRISVARMSLQDATQREPAKAELPLACPAPPLPRAPGPLDACAAQLPRAPHDTGWMPLTALLVRAVRTLLFAIAEPGNGDAAENAGGLARGCTRGAGGRCGQEGAGPEIRRSGRTGHPPVQPSCSYPPGSPGIAQRGEGPVPSRDTSGSPLGLEGELHLSSPLREGRDLPSPLGSGTGPLRMKGSPCCQDDKYATGVKDTPPGDE